MNNRMRWIFVFAVGLVAAPALHAMPGPAIYPLSGQFSNNAWMVQGKNSISGMVLGPARNAVSDIYLELLDEVGSTIGRAKTDASGRYAFHGLSDGRFKLRVLPYGTDYLEQEQEVMLVSISAVPGSGADRQQVDIVLRMNERALAGPFAAPPGVIFAQDVPAEAKKLYEAGVGYLREKKEKEGFESLKKAVEAFPDYYLALHRLGAEYAVRGTNNRNYLEAAIILLSRAVEVNPKGFSSVFALGWTQYQFGIADDAVLNLRKATGLYGKSADTYLWLGKALKRAGKLDQAEVAFKKADELTSGKSSEAHWQMAGLYGDQKRYKEAADELELFLKTEPEAADAERIRALITRLREKHGGK